MTTLNTAARRRISAGLGRATSSGLIDFLNSGDGPLTGSKAHREDVGSALMLWSTRTANTSITGVRIEGIHDLLAVLRSLDPHTVLERYDHHRNRALLTMYRELETKRPIGYQFVNTPRPARKRLGRLLGIVAPDPQARPAGASKRLGKPVRRSVLSVAASKPHEGACHG
jgi:hypothetical protein